MLQKRIHKLLIISVMMVLSILVMAFLFIDHGDDSLNHATYTTMNQEIDLCTQRISSQNHTDLVLLNTLAKSLSNSADIDSSLAEMEKENAFTSISYMDSQRGIYFANPSVHVEYNELSKVYKSKVDSAFLGKQSAFIQKQDVITKEFVITYIVPVYDSSKNVTGVLSATSSLKPYATLMKKSVYGGNLYITDLNDFYGIQKDKESKDVLAVLKGIDLSERINGLIGVNGEEHGIVVKEMGFDGWYLCYVNSAKSLNNPLYVMSRANNYVLMVFVVVVMILLWIAYMMMVKNNKEMENLAYKDQLTGAVSFTRFTKLVSMYAQRNVNYSLVSLNMRRFKFMNEILGRDKSDDFLCRVVACIQSMLKKDEIICRDSADVFYLLLSDTNEDEVARRIYDMFTKIRQNTKDFRYEYEFCCDVASNIEDQEKYTFEQMLTNVMFALAQSKEASSENICFFDEEVHKKKEFENFKNSHKHYETVVDGGYWVWIIVAMAVVAFVFMFMAPTLAKNGQTYYYYLAYGCIGLIFLGLAIDSYVRRRIYFTEDGFFFDDTYYRYRMLANFEFKNGVITHNCTVLMSNRDKIVVTKKMGELLQEKQKAFKKAKKERHK